MSTPRSIDARHFSRAAVQRFEEARFLLKHEFSTAAIYLAGYAVECILKALILSAVPESKSDQVLKSFKGQAAHNLESLKAAYVKYARAKIPPSISTHLVRARTWSTDIRYFPGILPIIEAQEYLAATEKILHWAKGRL